MELKSLEFRKEREASWRELDDLVTRVEKKSVKVLSAAELARLPMLYRGALSSLSVARSISLDRNVVDYLESLTGRAYFTVYGTKRHLRDAIADFFKHRFPASVRRFRRHYFISLIALVLGAITASVLVSRDQDKFYSFVDRAYAEGRGPTSSTEELKDVLYDSGGGTTDRLSNFATYLFTHNARIGMMAFALGFLAGVPVFFLMFTNGLILGAFAALYANRGLSVDFWGWVLPHGVTELSAVILCGAAGLAIAEALVFPGRHKRLDNLMMKGRDAAVMVIGCVVMFLVAGMIEGIFRQSVKSVPIRYGVAVITAVLWILYFAYVGRREEVTRGDRV
jgi:uncharacterized membrane protein SpoIIM required for sporulation